MANSVRSISENTLEAHGSYIHGEKKFTSVTVSSTESKVLMGDFYALVGTDTDMWKGVIGKHGVTGVNENGRYLLMLCW